MRREVHIARRKRRSFTAEFKADTVRLVREGKQSFSKVARDLDLMETSVREWVKQAEVDAGPGPSDVLTTAERAEIAQLRRDVKRLEMEREILKKWSCTFGAPAKE